MAVTTLGWVRTALGWAVGPWLCGYCAALALTLVRALMAGHASGGMVDLRLHGTLLVAARGHLVAAIAVAIIVAALLAVVLSRAMGGPL